jgi:hypothetical protein
VQAAAPERLIENGSGPMKKGQLWAYARDEHPWNGTAPPGVACVCALDPCGLPSISPASAARCK